MRIFKTASSSNISDKETSTKKPAGSFKQISENSQTAYPTNLGDEETSSKKPTVSFKQYSENFQTAPLIFLPYQEQSG